MNVQELIKQKWRQFRDWLFPPPTEATTAVKWQVKVRDGDGNYATGASVTVLELTSGSPVVVASGSTGPTGYFYYTPVGTAGVTYPYYNTPELWFRAEVTKEGFNDAAEDFPGYTVSSEFKPPPGGYFFEFRLYDVEVILVRKKVIELRVRR